MKELALVLVLVVACNSSSSGDDGVGTDAATSLQSTQSCERYLSCVLAAAPQSYAALLALYGASSECWKTPQQAMNCGRACDAAFENIEEQCTCAGTQCGPVTTTCADANEPNDDPLHAKQVYFAADGAVCPATDVDVFRFAVTGGGGMRVVAHVTYTSGGPLAVSLLDASGAAIALGTPQTGGVEVQAPSRPSAVFHVRITGAQKADYHLWVEMQ